MDTEYWFVARTPHLTEVSLRNTFLENEIEHFVPVRKALRKRKGEMVECDAPIIPNLVFFKADFMRANQLFRTYSTKLHRIFDRIKGGLLTVPERQMTSFIQLVEVYDEKVELLDSPYLTGDRVLIKKGPLVGLEGILIDMAGKNHFVVRLDGLLAVSVKLTKSELKKMGNKLSR